MFTKILDAINNKDNSIMEAIEWLKSGEPIAFPTETVYGLGAGLFDFNAVEKIYKIKGRAFTNPLSAHISNINDAKMLCRDIKDEFYILAEKFLPGPLSIIMRKRDSVPNIVTGGGDSLSIRMPESNIFIALSEQFAQPIAATSANKSGRPSPTNAISVLEDLNGEIPIILDEGNCRYQIESTVISLYNDVPELIRPGAITQSDIQSVLSKKIISRNRQLIQYDSNKSSLKNVKFQLICMSEIDKISDFISQNNDKKIALMSRDLSLFQNNIYKIRTNEIDFFTQLRDVEKNNFDILIVHIDDYIKSSEVLAHRLKIN